MECVDGNDCDGPDVCADGRCVECADDHDCPTSEHVCDDAECHGCRVDADCDADVSAGCTDGECTPAFIEGDAF